MERMDNTLDARTTVAIAWHPHHVEHLVPLCELFDAPLIALNGPTAKAAETCYPFDRVVRISESTLDPLKILLTREFQELLRPYKTILYSHLLFRKELKTAFGTLRRPPPHVVYCPHGFSEKKQDWSAISAYQDISILYGDFAVQQLEQWGVLSQLQRSVFCGNYRRLYWEKHRAFFDGWLNSNGVRTKHVHSRRTILYAPTWHDALRSSSFVEAIGILVGTLPPDSRLIIKPHPLLEAYIYEKFDKALANSDRIMLLRNTPLTFPILEIADAYVGDMSSIAYDFLAFDRPMVFLNQTAGDVGDASESALFSCGAVVDPVDYRLIYRVLEDETQFHQNRSELKRRLYHRVYADLVTLEDLRRDLEEALTAEPPSWLWNSE